MLERAEGTVQEKVQDVAPELAVSLSGEINAATRHLHTALNRLITSRLPLALPPHATNPSLYATGLLHFAHIFLTFESLWADMLRDNSPQIPSTPATSHGPASPPMSPLLSYLLVNPYDSPSLFTATLGAPTLPSPQLVAFLQTLRPRGLIRSARLKRDLEHLMGLNSTDLDVLLAKYPGDQVAEFCTHIRKTVHEKPWTLVSYAWCFYMAIFSGGRWIRAGLLNAGPEFWRASEEDRSDHTLGLAERGLSIWHFPGHLDGEDIKAEFKAQLATAETLFIPNERVDIIEEAKNIFQLCASLVQELDDMVGTDLAVAAVDDRTSSRSTTGTQKKSLIQGGAQPGIRAASKGTSSDPLQGLIRRPEVMGTLVALGCLACVALIRFQ